MTTWLDNYKRRLDSIIATKQAGVSVTGNNDLTNAYAAIAAASNAQRASALKVQANLAKNPVPTGGKNSLWDFFRTGSTAKGSKAWWSQEHTPLEKAYSTSFNALKSGGSRAIDLLSRGNYASANVVKEMTQPGPNDENFFEALWNGISGKEKTTYRDVLRQNYPDMGNKERAITGFAGDVFLDPTTYIGTGLIKSAGRAIGIGAKAATKAETIATVVKAEEKAGAVGKDTAGSLFEHLQRTNTSAKTLDQIPEQARPYSAKTGSTLTDVIRRQREMEVISARSRINAVGDEITKIPVLRYSPEQIKQIKAPYRTVVSAPEPKEVIVPKVGKAKKNRGLSEELADVEANYHYFLSNPSTRINVGTKGGQVTQVPVSDLLKLAKQSPEQAKMVDTYLRKAAKGIGKVDPKGRISLSGGKAALTHSQFVKLLRTGEVPKNKGGFFYGDIPEGVDFRHALTGGTKVDDFPLHDADDLNNFTIAGLSGEPEPVGEFLKRLGIKVKRVDPEKKAVDPIDELLASAPVVPGKGGKTFAPLTKKQLEKWVEDHKNILDPEDIKTLLSTKITGKSDAAFMDALLNKIGKRTAPANHSIDNLIAALKDGRVNPDDLKKLMELTGAKTPEGIRDGLEKMFYALADAEKALKGEDDAVAASGKLWESLNPVNESQAPVTVKSAEKILDDIVTKGDDSSAIKMQDTLDPQQVEDLGFVLKYAVDKDILSPLDLQKYGYKTSRKGSKRTHAKFGEGDARNLGEWNAFNQLNVFKAIVTRRGKEIQNAIKESGLKGAAARSARSAAMYEHALPIMRTFDKILVENGIPPTLVVDKTYTLSLADVLDSFPREFVEKHLFDMLTGKGGVVLHENIPPTLWSDAASFVLDYSRGLISEADARNIIGKILSTDHVTKYHKEPLRVGTAVKAAKLGEEAGVKYINGLVDQFMNKAQVLSQTVENNVAVLAAKNIDGAKAITEETMKAFAARITDPHFVASDIIDIAMNQDAVMESIAKSLGVSSKVAKTIAKSDVEVKMAAAIPPEVMAEAKGADAMSNVMHKKSPTYKTVEQWVNSPAGRVKVIHVAQKQMENAAESAAPFVDDIPVMGLDDLLPEVEATFTWKILHNFAPHLKNADVRPVYLGMNSATQTNAKAFARLFGRIAGQNDDETVQAAFKSLQRSEISANEKVAIVSTDIEKALKTLFRDDRYDLFSKNGITAHQVNEKLIHFGIDKKYALDPENINGTWRTWDFTDGEHPLQLLAKYQAALHASIMERQLGAKLSVDFGSKVPRAGYIKIKNNTRLGHLLDPDAYFPKEIASQFSVLNKLLEELAKPSSSEGWVKYYDAVLHSYKSGLTIYRPGHHFRNMVGDVWFNWMDGVNDPRRYIQAMDVMRDNWDRYNDWDALQALAAIGQTNAKSNKVVATARVAGKKLDLTTGDIYRAARERGILPDYGTLEDIGTNAERYLWKPHLPGKHEGKLHNLASTVSESRDHYIRLAHFIDRVEKGNGGSLEKIFDDAANRVRKWHPDGSDLTQFERKVMRRTVLFYSWQRKAIPLVLEAITHKPGKVMVLPKAMYALAEASGINPSTLSDPFPEDQLFPDWLREEVTGPQFIDDGRYWGINPGIPAHDILNDYANSPEQTVRNVAGSAPMGVKQLVEWLSADRSEGQQFKDIRTGIPSYDFSDYVDSQIPSFGYISKITGRSPSTLGIQARRQSRGATPEQAEKAAAKNTSEDMLTGLFNWMTGLSATDMSKPGTIKSAQFDQRDAIKKAMKDAAR